MLRFEDVTRRYGRVRALESASFELEKGTLTVLLGANGAGKSTLLRLAATLERPTSGRVLLGGLDARSEGAEARRHVAYLGQEDGLYGDLTVRENLAFMAAFHDRDFALVQAAQVCGVADRLDERAALLSRGQRQRAALARAMCAGDVMLLDEPTTALDLHGRSMVADTLAGLRGARTMLVATHDEHLLGVADRVLALEAGRVALDGSAEDGVRWLEAAA